MPADIDIIILNHHENAEGTGFPRSLSPNRTFPLSIVFIVAHDFVSHLYKIDFEEEKIPSVINAIEKKYAHIKEYQSIFIKFKEVFGP